MSMNLRTYFILIFSVFVIFFTSVISITISKESSESVENQISESLTEKAFQFADSLDHFMWSRYGEITVLSHLNALHDHNNDQEITELLNELKANFPSYSWIGFTDARGKVIASTDNILAGADISERPVFMEAQEDTFIGDVHEAVLLAKLLPSSTGEDLKFVDISSPIFNDNKEFVGVLAAHLSWEWAKDVQQSVIFPLAQDEKNMEVFIISKKDNTVLLGPNDMIGEPLNLNAINEAQSGENNWTLERWPDGKQYLTGYALADGFLNYPGLEWTVLVRQPEEVAFYNVNKLREKIIKLGSVFFILFAVIGWFFAGIISNPLRQLANTARRLRDGEKVDIPINKGIRDIETLAISLRDLITTLTRTKSDLGKMEKIAQQDNLTGLPNRHALDEYLEELNTTNNKAYAIMYTDLDGFKKVNDKFGHHHGDLVLEEVATRLKNSIRSSDFICRLGGDEFVIIAEMNDSSNHDVIDRLGQRVIESLNNPLIIQGIEITVGCSIGVALWPTDDKDLYQVQRYADKALYISKENGKNRLTYFKN